MKTRKDVATLVDAIIDEFGVDLIFHNIEAIYLDFVLAGIGVFWNEDPKNLRNFLISHGSKKEGYNVLLKVQKILREAE